MGAEVEAVLRVTEAEETTADLRLELEACKREVGSLPFHPNCLLLACLLVFFFFFPVTGKAGDRKSRRSFSAETAPNTNRV